MPILESLGIASLGEGLKAVGGMFSNVADRFWPKKMNESEKMQATVTMLGLNLQEQGLEVQDVNKAREMAMTLMKTQKLPWLARFLNGTLRPVAGYISLLYLTDKFWAQTLSQLIDGFNWKIIERDPVVDGLVAVVIYFFFGYRHKAKKDGVSSVG